MLYDSTKGCSNILPLLLSHVSFWANALEASVAAVARWRTRNEQWLAVLAAAAASGAIIESTHLSAMNSKEGSEQASIAIEFTGE